jgi:hypothetical protein
MFVSLMTVIFFVSAIIVIIKANFYFFAAVLSLGLIFALFIDDVIPNPLRKLVKEWKKNNAGVNSPDE